MVNFYIIIDFVLIGFIIFATDYSYKKKVYLKLFEYFKLFVIITVSAKNAHFTAVWLQKLHITSADTYTTLILMGFGLNFICVFFLVKYALIYSDKSIKNNIFKNTIARIVTFLEVIIVVTFSLYIFMQLSLSKIYLNKTLKKSYSYPYIQKFYIKFLNDDFVDMVLNSDTGINKKEIIFKSLKNSL